MRYYDLSLGSAAQRIMVLAATPDLFWMLLSDQDQFRRKVPSSKLSSICSADRPL
jgi:hypothetical protein